MQVIEKSGSIALERPALRIAFHKSSYNPIRVDSYDGMP
jgi:hypothetical protein